MLHLWRCGGVRCSQPLEVLEDRVNPPLEVWRCRMRPTSVGVGCDPSLEAWRRRTPPTPGDVGCDPPLEGWVSQRVRGWRRWEQSISVVAHSTGSSWVTLRRYCCSCYCSFCPATDGVTDTAPAPPAAPYHAVTSAAPVITSKSSVAGSVRAAVFSQRSYRGRCSSCPHRFTAASVPANVSCSSGVSPTIWLVPNPVWLVSIHAS